MQQPFSNCQVRVINFFGNAEYNVIYVSGDILNAFSRSIGKDLKLWVLWVRLQTRENRNTLH